jgi:hypothetical protein
MMGKLDAELGHGPMQLNGSLSFDRDLLWLCMLWDLARETGRN